MIKLSSKNLKWIRNTIITAEMIVLFILWSYIPAIIENNSTVHVGNGKYGSKAGFLLLTLLPLLGLTTHGGHKWDDEDIHTDNAMTRALIEEERKTESLKNQILLSFALFFTSLFGIILTIIFC